MTTRTITAMFDQRADAERARQELRALGLTEGDVRIVDKTEGGAAAADEHERDGNGFLASLRDFLLPADEHATYAEGIRRGGFLLTARVDEQRSDQAIGVLERSNAVDLDQREQQWRGEGWSGPRAQGGGAAGAQMAAQGADAARTEETIPVVEERLRVGKREASRGGARVRAYVVETPVHEQVRLREEHVELERRPVDKPVPGTGEAAAAAANDLLQERTIDVTERREEPVVTKEARVKEEIAVSKRVDERVADVKDTVRHTEVDVERDAQQRTPPERPRKGGGRSTGRPDAPRR